MTANHRPRPVSCDPLYETARQTAGRLTTGVATVHRLINEKVIPARSINGRKIAKIVAGQLLASAYEIWPPEYRPQYTPEELRRLAGITVEEVAAQLGIGRSGAYEAVRNRQIPAIQLPSTDRWVVPEDAAARMEAYDLRNFTLMSLPEDRREFQPLKSEADDPATDDEVVAEDAANVREVEPRDLGLGTRGTKQKSDIVERGVRAPQKSK
jgi:excisionase family DNA binding protein